MTAGRTAAPRDVLHDPHRVAAARRLLLEVSSPAAFDRLSRLAAQLLNAGHAKVTLFTDGDTVIGGYGLPPGVIGGPALLTGALSAITVRQGTPFIVPDAAADPRVADLPAVTSGQVRAYVGSPLVAASGHVVGVLTVYDPVPRTWTDVEAELLQQLAASVVAELELSAARSAIGTSRTRLDIALEAGAVGTWERDLRTGVVYWDERCAAIFGMDGAVELDQEGDLLDRVHPDDRELVQQAMQGAIAASGEFVVETRVLRTDGEVRWTVSRGRAVRNSRGELVRIIGTTVDVTDARQEAERRLSAVQRAAAMAEVAAQLANATRMRELADVALRGAQVLGAVSSATAVLEADGMLRMHLSRELGRSVADAAPEMEMTEAGVEVALDDRGPGQYTAKHGVRILLRDRLETIERFPHSQEAMEVLDLDAVASLPLRVEGRLLGSFVALWRGEHAFTPDDIELLEALAAQIALSVSRLQADQERAAAVAAMADANRRLQLLADVGRVLSGTLDIAQQIDRLTELLVPGLGDWCWIVVTDEQGRLHEMASTHRDPARRDMLLEYVRHMVTVMTDEAGARVVARTGRPEVRAQVDWAEVERVLPDPVAQQSLTELDLGASAIVPLVARGQILGALGLFNTTARGAHTPGELETATEVGRRAGLALQQARLFGQQRALADELQRSLLTEPPKPEHCRIVVRYVPAAAGAEIGGDWYDAFLQPDGTTVLAIGDVVGHDIRAAAAMGQVRGLLRGISYSSEATPADVLSELDRAVQGLALDTMATAVVARLERSGDGDGRTWLRYANAGHPAPIVVSPDGEVTVLDAHDADLLLGVAPETHRTDRVFGLEPGSTVLLYTDGLVERRDRDIDEGTAALVEALRSCADVPLDDLCDQLLARLFLPDAEDDVAVLAVRLDG